MTLFIKMRRPRLTRPLVIAGRLEGETKITNYMIVSVQAMSLVSVGFFASGFATGLGCAWFAGWLDARNLLAGVMSGAVAGLWCTLILRELRRDTPKEPA